MPAVNARDECRRQLRQRVRSQASFAGFVRGALLCRALVSRVCGGEFSKQINKSGPREILRSLPGPSLFVCACWLPVAAASSSVERQTLPDGVPLHCSGRLSSVPTVPCLQQLRHGAAAAADSRWLSATAPRPATAPPQRPGQQQTSSGGEKCSGLASNLAHLGRIC